MKDIHNITVPSMDRLKRTALQDVQNTLMQTVRDVTKIQREGTTKLLETEKQILTMREDLRTRTTLKGGNHGV